MKSPKLDETHSNTKINDEYTASRVLKTSLSITKILLKNKNDLFLFEIIIKSKIVFRITPDMIGSILLLLQLFLQMGNRQPSNFINDRMMFDEEPFPIQDEGLMKRVLHRSIGGIWVYMVKRRRYSGGSGVLISKNLLLTAAHNIYDKEQQCENRDLKFYPGANGAAEIFYEPEAWRYPEQFKTCPNDMRRLQYDYALVKLRQRRDHPIDYTQFPALTVPCEICMLNRNSQINLQIYGYPYHNYNYQVLDQFGNKIRLYQYGLARTNRIRAIEPHKFKISYTISTFKAHSGSPVVAEDNIIALHNGSTPQEPRPLQEYNIGRVITFCLLDNLKLWSKQLQSQPYRTNFDNFCTHLQTQKKLFPSKNHRRIPQKIRKILQKSRMLKRLEINSSNLRAIDLVKHISLQQLYLWDNKLSTIDLRANINLTKLQLGKNRISSIDLSKNANLSHLQLKSNQLRQINLSQNTKLNYLNLNSNKIIVIDLTANINLTELWLSQNMLTYADLSRNAKVKQLMLYNNRLDGATIWYSEQLSLYLHNQQSESCLIKLLHRKKNYQQLSDSNNYMGYIHELKFSFISFC